MENTNPLSISRTRFQLNRPPPRYRFKTFQMSRKSFITQGYVVWYGILTIANLITMLVGGFNKTGISDEWLRKRFYLLTVNTACDERIEKWFAVTMQCFLETKLQSMCFSDAGKWLGKRLCGHIVKCSRKARMTKYIFL